MGTDIHLYVERRTATGWERVRPDAWTCPWCNGKGTGRKEEPCYWCKGEGSTRKEYHERNYDLFAMLAGVRNGSGFAGCDTGDGFAPLDEPRGLPDDTSIKDTEGDDDSWDHPDHIWLGDHSHSHATLAEVQAYDFDRKTAHRGCVNAAEYAAWVEAGRKGQPKSYSGGVRGRDIENVSPPDMDRLLRSGAIDTTDVSGPFDAPKAKDGKAYYTVVEWESSYRDSAGKAWFDFLDACRPLGDPKDVRFVFGFDS